MSRFFKIDINNGQYVFTNQLPDGKLDPGGWRVEMDVQAAPYATPTGQSTVTVWGVPLQLAAGVPGVAQASDLNNLPITVSGGMQAGLPLASADAPQAGVLISGVINQAYGNWMDVAQSLVFVITGDGAATQASPTNIVVNWKKGQGLKEALTQTLTTAYPKLKLDVQISDDLKLAADEVTTYNTIQQLAQYVKQVSQSIKKSSAESQKAYPGVDIWVGNGVINVFDGTNQANPKKIEFVDMIGQPTWLGAFELSFNTVMRADIGVGSTIKLPELSQLQSVTTPQSQSLARNKSAFQGTWGISAARHVGDSRAPSAMSWISVFQAFSNDASQPVTGGQDTAA